MGITKFFLLLMVIAFAFLGYEKVEKKVVINNEKKPKISFENSQMYEITQKGIVQVVQSKQAMIYDNREELYDASIVQKTQNSDDTTSTDTISGNSIIKIKNDLYLDGAVSLQLSDGTNLKTEQLNYNTETKIAKNSTTFELTRGGDQFYGKDLYFDGINKHIIAQNTKFKIKVTNE